MERGQHLQSMTHPILGEVSQFNLLSLPGDDCVSIGLNSCLVQTPKFESIKVSRFKSHPRCYFPVLKMWGIFADKKLWVHFSGDYKERIFFYFFFLTISLICVLYSTSMVNRKEILSSPKRLYNSQPLESLDRATTIFILNLLPPHSPVMSEVIMR